MGNLFSSFILIAPKSVKSRTGDGLLVFLTMFSILFIPNIKINAQLFLGIEELLIILMGLRLIFAFWVQIDQMILLLGILSVIILTSILANSNFRDYREYLEIHKLAKFVVVYLYSIFYFKDNLNYKNLINWITVFFIGMLVFNIFHLFNLFYFNELVTVLYDTDGRDVLTFGKNSIGGPGPKRIVGTMGNPNINAILFLFFAAFYSFLLIECKKQDSPWNIYSKKGIKALFLLSILFVILCQSRTGIVALTAIYLLGVLWRKASPIEVISEILCISAFFILSAFLDTIALQYLFKTKPQIQENNSLAARIKVWTKLFNMWTQNPIFGYGPNKAYMYQEKLYPENEYIFYLWRYGVQGLIAYISMLFIPIYHFYKENINFRLLLMVTIVISMVALMNNPLANAKISIITAFLFGVSVVNFMNLKKKQEGHA